ncbi:FAD-dependent oxidoreductase, partial [Natronospira sp.]
MNRDYDIAVIGAGPIGAASALGLARAGYQVALVDAQALKDPVTQDEPLDLRVFAVSRASRRLFQKLHAWSAMEAVRVSPYRHMTVWDAHGRVEFDAADVAEAELGHIVENRVIQAALHQQLRESPIDCFLPDRLERLSLEPTGSLLGLAKAGRLRARLVVAADGGASPTREMAGIKVNSLDHEQVALVAHIRSEIPHGETARQRFLDTGPLALLPLADGRCSIVWSTTPAEA